jgi:hypothetical protein
MEVFIMRGFGITSVTALVVITSLISIASAQAQEFRRIPVAEYRDKMKAGWVGQVAGVSLGDPTEFEFLDKIIPEDAMPIWKPSMLNGAFGQDDLYVEMTFLRSMEQYGLDISIRQAGIDFANSGYPLWCANNAGRHNLRMGIAPPDSSHPEFNRRPNDIDYQIEADYSGLIAPGMPNVAVALGEKFGRLMNYGDGVYAGQFIGAMYAEAFFETDIVRIIEAGLEAIPAESQYAEMVRDMLAWSKEYPTWQACWARCQKKYRKDPAYQKASNGHIDCKINGAYVLMGLLYGKGDLDQTMIISCRCGLDSDCNPSSSAGILFTSIGFSKLPEPPEEIKKLIKNDDITSAIKTEILPHVSLQYMINDAAQIGEALCNKKWDLFLSEKDCYVTSDTPVIFGPPPGSNEEIGPANPQSLVICPLNKYITLSARPYLSSDNSSFEFKEAENGFVVLVNKLQCFSSQRFVYSPFQSEELLEYVKSSNGYSQKARAYRFGDSVVQKWGVDKD